MALTDLKCRKSKAGPRLFKLSDGGGLQLWVFPNGSKLWRFAYRFAGKQKLLALGRYPETSLLSARFERDKAKLTLADGIDPGHERQIERLEKEYPGDTFEVVANEFVAKLRREGRSDATLTKVQWLLDFALPTLGPLKMRTIKPIEVLAVLQRVEKRGRHETARRLRSTIGGVFRYAVATTRADEDPTVALRDALTVPTVTARAAIIEPRAFGALLRAIDGFSGQPTTKFALQLMALLFPRPGELRLASWPEFDLESRTWTIPADRTKMRRTHRVPLARQALALLADLHILTGGGHLLFPSVRSLKRPMSENTMNGALRRLGYSQEEATAHGFRATASTLLNESGLWSADAIERQLSHLEQDEIRRAYARGEHWDERVRMMSWWADHLDSLKTVGTVIPIVRSGS